MTYLVTSSTSVAVESVINLLYKKAYHDYPVLSMFMPGGKTAKDGSVKNIQHYWTEKTLNSTRGTLAADINNSTTTVTVSNKYMNFITTGGSGYYTYIQIDDEIIKVASASLSGDTWTLTCTAGRGALSSSAAAHSAGAKVMINNIVDENMDASFYESDNAEKPYNYTQIFQSAVKLSGSAQAIETYGNELDINVQVDEKIGNLMQQIENALYSPTRYSSSLTRKMGGLCYFTTAAMTKDSAGNAFSLKALASDVESLYERGVNTKNMIMLAGSGVLDALNSKKADIVSDTMKVRELDYNIQRISVPGNFSLPVVEWAPVIGKNEYFIIDKDSVKVKFLRPLKVEDLAKTGDHDRKLVVMEATAEFHSFQQDGALRRKNIA